MKRLSYLFLVILGLGSCTNDDDAQDANDSLLGSWELVTFTTDGGDEIDVPPEITLTFEQGPDGISFNGASSCNSYLGTILVMADNELNIVTIGSSERGCVSEVLSDFETLYLNTLATVRNYTFQENRLVLLIDDTALSYTRKG